MPELLSSEVAYAGYFDVIVDQIRSHRTSHQIAYSKLNLKAHAVAILARTYEGKIVATREYRHPIRKWVLGCPGGRIDTGESPIEAGRRELLEETGYTAETFSLLGTIYPLPAVTDQQIFYVLADGASLIGPTALEPLELIHPEEKSLAELRTLLTSDTPIDGIFCTGLLLLTSFAKNTL